MAFHGERWTLANVVPIIFIIWLFLCTWGLYVSLHLLPQLQFETLDQDGIGRRNLASNVARYRRGVVEAVSSQFLSAVVLVCFLKAMFTDPGGVPESPEWRPSLAKKMCGHVANDSTSAQAHQSEVTHEAKRSGARRFCKWCSVYKPDRAHHCRMCRSCITRMDHHCPWVANCIGYRNYKYFFLLLLYAGVGCWYMLHTIQSSVALIFVEEFTPTNRFLIVLCATMLFIMGSVLVVFLTFHVFLMIEATTTIEFCEKAYSQSRTRSVYYLGIYKNIEAMLGPRPYLWLLPTAGASGDGTYFPVLVGHIKL